MKNFFSLEDAFLLALTAFIIQIKFINYQEEELHDALARLYKVIKVEYNEYYKDKDNVTVSEDSYINYFTKNFSLIGYHFANRWIQTLKKGRK